MRIPEFLRILFDTSDFTPRWVCGHWTALHGWTHIASDVAIGGPTRRSASVGFLVSGGATPLPRIFWLFAAFIFTCGTPT